MSDKITGEEIVGKLDDMIAGRIGIIIDAEYFEFLQAIRKLILDYAELTKKLSEVKFDIQNPNRLGIKEKEASDE